jgi:hypothetical protein
VLQTLLNMVVLALLAVNQPPAAVHVCFQVADFGHYGVGSVISSLMIRAPCNMGRRIKDLSEMV